MGPIHFVWEVTVDNPAAAAHDKYVDHHKPAMHPSPCVRATILVQRELAVAHSIGARLQGRSG